MIITFPDEQVELFLLDHILEVLLIKFVLIGLEAICFGETGYNDTALVGAGHSFVVYYFFVFVGSGEELFFYLLLHVFLASVHFPF